MPAVRHRRYRMRMRGRIRELEAAGIGRDADINALRDLARQSASERRQHIVQHLRASARIRTDEVFRAEAFVRAVVVDDQIHPALILLRRIGEQLFLCNIGRNDILRVEIIRRITVSNHWRIASCDLRILQNIRPLADLAQTAAQSAGAACGIAVRAAVGQDENIVMRLQSGSRFSNVNDHSSSSPPSFPSFFSSCSISEMCAPRVIDSSSSNTSSGA